MGKTLRSLMGQWMLHHKIGALFDTNRHAVRQLIRHSGIRAGIKGLHPHRFRHTFAILYLRRGASIYHLQEALGHKSLDMCRHYLQISQSDLEEAALFVAMVNGSWKLKPMVHGM